MDKEVEKIVLTIAILVRQYADVHGHADPRSVGEKIAPRDRAIIASLTTEDECVKAIGAYMLFTDGIGLLRRVYEGLDIKDLHFDLLAEKTDEEISSLHQHEDGGPNAYALRDELEGEAADPYLVHKAAVAIAWSRMGSATSMLQKARAILNKLGK